MVKPRDIAGEGRRRRRRMVKPRDTAGKAEEEEEEDALPLGQQEGIQSQWKAQSVTHLDGLVVKAVAYSARGRGSSLGRVAPQM